MTVSGVAATEALVDEIVAAVGIEGENEAAAKALLG